MCGSVPASVPVCTELRAVGRAAGVLGSHPLLDELEEHSARSPAPTPVFGQHPTSRLDLERFGEQVYGPSWT
jgi:hypothetical protein